MEKQNFTERLKTSKTLKIGYKGKYYKIPPAIFRQAKKFAMESAGIEYDVFNSKKNPTKTQDQKIQEAFESFLESYLESVVPAANPYPKIKQVYKTVDELVNIDSNNSFLKRWFPDKTEKERKAIARSLKTAVMTITHVYCEGQGKIRTHDKKQTLGKTLKSGYAFEEDDSADKQLEVHRNRLFRSTVGFYVLMMVSKIFSTDADTLKVILKDKIPGDKLASFWRDKNISTQFFMDLKTNAGQTLDRVDFFEPLRNTATPRALQKVK